MALAERVRQQADELGACLARIRDRGYQATVSTMTLTARLNVQRVCRTSLMIATSLTEDEDGAVLSGQGKGTKRRRRPRATFGNQMTLRHGTKSIKVFDNGSIHVTGCTSHAQFAEVADALCTFMTDVVGVVTDDGTGIVRVTAFDTQMINLNFGLDRRLHLQGLRDEYAARGYQASYDSDIYPGLNVKLPVGDRRVTALLFKSGRVIITGAKTAEQLDTAHVMLTAVLDGQN